MKCEKISLWNLEKEKLCQRYGLQLSFICKIFRWVAFYKTIVFISVSIFLYYWDPVYGTTTNDLPDSNRWPSLSINGQLTWISSKRLLEICHKIIGNRIFLPHLQIWTFCPQNYKLIVSLESLNLLEAGNGIYFVAFCLQLPL